mgnify:CR=1 FL=1
MLEKCERVIEYRKRELNELDSLIKARFVEMFYEKGYPVLKWNDVFITTTGKLDSNASVEKGAYPFFTCSREPLKISTYSYDCECVLVAGNGDLNVKYYNGKFDAYQRTYIIEDNSDGRLFMPYLYYFMEGYVEELRKQAIGGVIKYIKLGNLTDAMIELSDVEIQKKIVNILSKTKGVLDSRSHQIDMLDNLIKARFVELFGDININDKNWKYEPLGELCTIVRGGSPRPIEQFLGGDVPWIKIGDATDGDSIYLNSTKEHIIQEGIKKSRLVKEGSLIFANCGVSLGFARIITFDGCIHDGWLAMEDIDERLDKVFLLQALNQMTEHFRAIAPAGTQPNLNTAIMKAYKQVIPPIELQREFINFAKQVTKSKVV